MEASEADPVLIREFNPAIRGEENFILSTWLRELRDADPSGLPDDLWYEAHRRHIMNQLADGQVTVLVAAASDAPEEILGYVVGVKGERLEWVHVRKNLRRKGLAKRLLQVANLEPGLPARFKTKWSHLLKHPWRPRQLRAQSRTLSLKTSP